MPELPEVETIKRGLTPHLQNALIKEVRVSGLQLRWPIPVNLAMKLKQQRITHLARRGKYLLITVGSGTLIIHLGLSGSLRIVDLKSRPFSHDHLDVVFSQNKLLRYTDPRRFGAILWTEEDPLTHPLLQSIGIEPLEEAFTGEYLRQFTAKTRRAIKPLLMDSKVVAGIGNIYAAEVLFLARIHPQTPANQLSEQLCQRLVRCTKEVLSLAIDAGGTTVKDFVNSEGKPGYFSQKLYVYGREHLPCRICGVRLKGLTLGQRSTVFCEFCQGSFRQT